MFISRGPVRILQLMCLSMLTTLSNLKSLANIYIVGGEDCSVEKHPYIVNIIHLLRIELLICAVQQKQAYYQNVIPIPSVPNCDTFLVYIIPKFAK